MSTTNWFWLKPDEYGGAGGSAASKLMRASTFSAAALLCREVIQNSWDAAQQYRREDKNHQFKVVFRFAKLTNFELESRRRALGHREIGEHISGSDISAKEKKAVQTGFFSNEPEATVLYIEDFGAHGLSGHPKLTRKSHLFKALYAFGITAKDNEAGGGGSYGFGKSAFIRASRSHTVVAYSCFEPTINDHKTRRLVGWSWWEGHETLEPGGKSVDHQGRAIFGVFSSSDSSGIVHVEPYEDSRADEVATSLGIEPREPGNRLTNGTSLMLLDPSVTPDEIVKSIEDYWWPALVDNLMTISVVDENGDELHPKPRQRDDLKPFIRAYELATSPADAKLPNTEMKEVVNFKPLNDKQNVGQIAAVSIDGDLDSLDDEDFKPRVALIRGPRMVINYFDGFTRKKVPIRAAFVTDATNEVADSLLKETEPPAHDVWDRQLSTDISEEATKLAKFVMSQISASVNKFAGTLQPSSEGGIRKIPIFSKFFGQLLGDSGGDSIGPADRLDVSITYGKRGLELTDADRIHYKAHMTLTPGAKAFEKFGGKGVVTIAIALNVVEDESKTGASIPLELVVDGAKINVPETGVITVAGSESTPIKIEMASAPYNHKWTTKLRAEVIKIDAEGTDGK